MTESTDQKQRISSLIAIATVSLLIGIGIGIATSLFFRNNGTEFSEQLEVPTYSGDNEQEQASSTPTTAPIGKQPSTLKDFTDLSKFKSNLARSSALYQFLAAANADQLREYLKQANAISEGPIRESIENAIMQHLGANDPTLALDIADEFGDDRREKLVTWIFQDWSMIALDNAIEHAASLDEHFQWHAITGILLSKQSSSIDELRTLAQRAGNEDAAITFIAYSKSNTYQDDPESAWNNYVAEVKTQSKQPSDAYLGLLINVAKAWIQKDGVGVLTRISETLENPEVERSLFLGLFSRFHGSHPQLALDVILNSPHGVTRHMARNVVEDWAKSEPRAALDAALDVDSPSLRSKLLDHALTGWASSSPSDLLNETPSLPESIRGLSLEKALISLARSEPQTVIAYLDQISTQRSKNAVTEAIAIGWAKQELAAALGWIRSESHTSKIQSKLLKSVFRELANNNPRHAFQAAVGQPLDESLVGLEVEVLNWVSYNDPDLAIALLKEVDRNEETKTEAFSSLIRTLAFTNNPRSSIEVALEFAQTGTYVINYQSIFSMVANSDPELLLETFDQLPSGELKSHIANQLLKSVNLEENLSKEQIERLKGFESEDPQFPTHMSDRLREAFEKVNEIIEEETE